MEHGAGCRRMREAELDTGVATLVCIRDQSYEYLFLHGGSIYLVVSLPTLDENIENCKKPMHNAPLPLPLPVPFSIYIKNIRSSVQLSF